jgi:hypothetical protein
MVQLEATCQLHLFMTFQEQTQTAGSFAALHLWTHAPANIMDM